MTDPIRVTVTIEQRGDGGIRIYSEDVPGLALSSKEYRLVAEDMMLALGYLVPELFDPIDED